MKQYWSAMAPLCALIVFALSFPQQKLQAQAPGSSELEGLRAFKILVERLDKDAEAEQIDRQMLEDQVLVTMRSKAPRLRYDSGVIPYIYVNLTLMTSETRYVGNLQMELVRPVEVLVGVHRIGDVPTKRVWTTAAIWTNDFTFSGPRGEAAAHVRRLMDRLLEKFLADYFRANP